MKLKSLIQLSKRYGVLEIPVSAKIRKLVKDFFTFRLERNFLYNGNKKICIISFHDYDLESFRFRFVLNFIIWIFKLMKFDFISTKTFYKELNYERI